MRVLFCTTGGAGHLQPLRPLARQLRRRGHALAWVTAPDALRWLRHDGFTLFAAGPTFEDSRGRLHQRHPELEHLRGEPLSAHVFPRLFGGILAPAMVDDLARAVDRWRPDLVVHEPAALAAPLVCRLRGIRHVTHGYGLPPPTDHLAAAVVRFEHHWQAHGLVAPADGGLYRHLYLDISPPSLHAPSALPACRVRHFNVHRPDRTARPPPCLRMALRGAAAPRPRVYVSFGTVFNRSPVLADAAAAAARVAGAVLVTAGADGNTAVLQRLSARVHVFGFVDQRALLPHCDAMVSHGGAGTVLGAAAHGLPQLLLPQAADHFRNARALSSVGAADSIAPGAQTVHAVADALADLLADAQRRVAARGLADEMLALPDAADMARSLEQEAR